MSTPIDDLEIVAEAVAGAEERIAALRAEIRERYQLIDDIRGGAAFAATLMKRHLDTVEPNRWGHRKAKIGAFVAELKSEKKRYLLIDQPGSSSETPMLIYRDEPSLTVTRAEVA